MTQLLLFQPSTETRHETPSPKRPAESGTVKRTASHPAHRPSNSDGVQHMGDLARAVLMRYEMVARRRAALAEKRRQAALAQSLPQSGPSRQKSVKTR